MNKVQTSADFELQPSSGSRAVTLAESASQRLAHLSERQGKPVLLRVAVEGGGCSGFQYRFELVDAAAPDDLRIETQGQAAIIDPVSLPFLAGSEIAFVDDLSGAQFVVKNPNAASSCGCGVSFSI